MSIIPQNMAVQSDIFMAAQLETNRCVERFLFACLRENEFCPKHSSVRFK